MGPMIRRTVRTFPVLVALAAVTACTGRNAVNQGVNGSIGWEQGDQATTWIAASDRSPVDGVSGSLLDGASFNLAQWRGHVVVINFWGSWCGPCTGETKYLEAVYQHFQKNGVEFLGVDIKETPAQAESFIRTHHVAYHSLSDPSNLLALRFHGLPPNATPTTVVLDREGRIAARHSGAIFYTALRDLVARAVAEPT
jgi:peroxiredoxin